MSKIGTTTHWTDNWAAGNSTFAIGLVTCFYDTFMVKESVLLRMNIYAEQPTHRKSAKPLAVMQWQKSKIGKATLKF